MEIDFSSESLSSTRRGMSHGKNPSAGIGRKIEGEIEHTVLESLGFFQALGSVEKIPLFGGDASYRFAIGSEFTSGVVAKGITAQGTIIIDLKLEICPCRFRKTLRIVGVLNLGKSSAS